MRLLVSHFCTLAFTTLVKEALVHEFVDDLRLFESSVSGVFDQNFRSYQMIGHVSLLEIPLDFASGILE